jgi:PAS domain S-box-containing protein
MDGDVKAMTSDPAEKADNLPAPSEEGAVFQELQDAFGDLSQVYHTMVDAMSDMVHIVDSGLRIQLFNATLPRWCRKLGIDAPSLGATVFETFPFLPDEVRVEYEQVFRTGEPVRTQETSNLGGDRIVTETEKLPIGNDRPPRYVVTVIRDITERVRVRHELDERNRSLQKLEAIINHSPAMAFRWRVAEGFPVEFASENVTQLGYTAEGFTSGQVSWPGITHPEDHPRLEAEVERFLRDGREEFSQEYRIRSNSGEYRWIEDRNRAIRDADGKVTHIEGILLDVTHRRQIEEDLRNSEAQYRAIVEDQTELIGRCTPDTKLSFVNDALCKYYGKSREELIGKSFMSLVAKEDRATVERHMARLGVDTPSIAIEHRVIAADGSIRWQQWINRVILDANGSVREFQGVGRDVTERRRLQNEILEVSHREQQRIGHGLHDSLGQQLAGIGFLCASLERDLGTDEKRSAASKAAKITKLVRESILQARRLARGLSPVGMTDTGLTDALEQMAADTRELFRMDCRLAAPETAAVRNHAVATHLYHVAQEAVTNALRHAAPKTVTIRLALNGEDGRLVVQDDGTGMRVVPDDCEGLGLRIMRYRAGMIGGTLQIQSHPGKGTTVRCTFVDRPGAVAD